MANAGSFITNIVSGVNLSSSSTQKTTINSSVTSGGQGTPGVGLKPGGTAGQYLVKNSNTDYDTVWSTFDGRATGLLFTSPNGTVWSFSITDNGQLISTVYNAGSTANTYGSNYGTAVYA